MVKIVDVVCSRCKKSFFLIVKDGFKIKKDVKCIDCEVEDRKKFNLGIYHSNDDDIFICLNMKEEAYKPIEIWVK